MKQKNGGTRSSQAIRSLRPFVHNASIFFEHHNDAKALSNLERFSRIFPESYEERKAVKEGENEHSKSKKKTIKTNKQYQQQQN